MRRTRFKNYGVQITRPEGRIDLAIPAANWTDEYAEIMREIEKLMVQLFKGSGE